MSLSWWIEFALIYTWILHLYAHRNQYKESFNQYKGSQSSNVHGFYMVEIVIWSLQATLKTTYIKENNAFFVLLLFILYFSFFVRFSWTFNKKWKLEYNCSITNMLSYPMSPGQCLLHYVILFHLHSTISSIMCVLTKPVPCRNYLTTLY